MGIRRTSEEHDALTENGVDEFGLTDHYSLDFIASIFYDFTDRVHHAYDSKVTSVKRVKTAKDVKSMKTMKGVNSVKSVKCSGSQT